jgi:Flp pilus assembly pilin Flp
VLIRFWRDVRAATAIEYCFLACLVSIGIVAAARSIGTRLVVGYYGQAADGLR